MTTELSTQATPRRFIEPMNSMAVGDAIERFRAPTSRTYKVQILRPFGVHSRRSYSSTITLPIGQAYLAGMLDEAGYAVGIIDAIGEDLEGIRVSQDGRYRLQGLSSEAIINRIDQDTDVLGVSLMFSQEWPPQRDLIMEIRSAFPNLTIVVGGEHATALPEHVLNTCPAVDYLVRGEGELTFLELVSALAYAEDPTNVGGVYFLDESGTLVNGGLSRRIADVDNIPRPAWHLLDVEDYFVENWTMGVSFGRNMPILATRGCPYQCTFCSNPFMWTTRYLMRNPASVVDEIEDLMQTYDVKSIDFADLTAIVKIEWILEFCDELHRRSINVIWQLPSGTRSEALDEETLTAIRKSGCSFLTYAPESASQETLDMIKKRLKISRLTESVQNAVDVGHSVKINLIIGFPHETRRMILQTLRFVWRMATRGVHDCNVAIFTPYPGSELYDELRDENKIGSLDDQYFHDLLIQFDFTMMKSYCNNVPGWELAIYRFLAMALFYLISYGSHPNRLFRLVRSLLSKDFQAHNIFEQRVYDYLVRARLLKRSST